MGSIPTVATVTAATVAPATWGNSVATAVGYFGTGLPIAILRQTVTQNLTTATATAITFDTEDVDRDGGHSTSVNTSRYTPATAGYYLALTTLYIAANTTHTRKVWLRVNNTTDYAVTEAAATVEGDWGGFAGTILPFMNGTTDYVEVYGFQNSGGTLATSRTLGDPRFCLLLLSG